MQSTDHLLPEKRRSSAAANSGAMKKSKPSHSVIDNRPEGIAQRKLSQSIKGGAPLQRTVIQRHEIDNDVIIGNDLDAVLDRIDAIAKERDTREPLEVRLHDLWQRQNILLNGLRSDLEEQSAMGGTSMAAMGLSMRVTAYTLRLAVLKAKLEEDQYTLPPTVPYTSKVGINRAYDEDR